MFCQLLKSNVRRFAGVLAQISICSLSLLLTLHAARAEAEDAVTLAQAPTVTEAKTVKPQGWTHKLTVGATGAYGTSSNVVGSVDGSTTQVGLIIDGSSERVRGAHEWLTAYKMVQTQSQTPQLADFFKSADSFELISTYMHRFPGQSWLGPYARAKATTSLFAGYVVKAAAVTLKKTKTDGATELEPLDAQRRSRTSSPFEPLLLGESAGLFAYPIESKALTIKTRAGAASQQIIAQDGFAIADDAKTPELELKQLRTSNQIGGELELALTGDIDTSVSWRAKSNIFMPLYTNGGPQPQLTGLDAMSTDVSGGLSIKLAKWASLDYIVTVKRIPLVLDKWQVQNGLLLTTSFSVL